MFEGSVSEKTKAKKKINKKHERKKKYGCAVLRLSEELCREIKITLEEPCPHSEYVEVLVALGRRIK